MAKGSKNWCITCDSGSGGYDLNRYYVDYQGDQAETARPMTYKQAKYIAKNVSLESGLYVRELEYWEYPSFKGAL